MDAGAGPFRSGGGSFAGLAAAIGPVVKPFADAVQLAKKHEKKHTEKGMGEGRQDKAEGDDAYGRGGVKKKKPPLNQRGRKTKGGD